MNLEAYRPLSGDVGFVGYDRGRIIPDAIRFFTRGKGESPTRAVHQFQVLMESEIVEALASGVVVKTWQKRKAECEADNAHYIIFRPKTAATQRLVIHSEGKGLRGCRYGFTEVLLQGLDGFLRKIGLLRERKPLFTKLGTLIPWTVICSRVGNICLHRVGILPHNALAWAPDDTFDWAVKHWKIVAVGKQGLAYWGLAET